MEENIEKKTLITICQDDIFKLLVWSKHISRQQIFIFKMLAPDNI